MSSLDKMLGLLSLFSDSRVEIDRDEVATLLQCSRATAYRYLKALSDTGMLVSPSSGVFVLGPRVIELDRLIRCNDPLLRASRPSMEELNSELDISVMLCSYYGDHVLCVDSIWTETGGPRIHYERGRPMSIFAGSMAKVILANVSSYQRRNLMLHHAQELHQAGLGANWKEFSANLQRIRRERVCITRGEVVADLTGVAAPIFDSDNRVLGSITLVVDDQQLSQVDPFTLSTRIEKSADQITNHLRRLIQINQ